MRVQAHNHTMCGDCLVNEVKVNGKEHISWQFGDTDEIIYPCLLYQSQTVMGKQVEFLIEISTMSCLHIFLFDFLFCRSGYLPILSTHVQGRTVASCHGLTSIRVLDQWAIFIYISLIPLLQKLEYTNLVNVCARPHSGIRLYAINKVNEDITEEEDDNERNKIGN